MGREEQRPGLAFGVGRCGRVLVEERGDPVFQLGSPLGREVEREPARAEIGGWLRVAQLGEEGLERGPRNGGDGVVVDLQRPRASGRAVGLLDRAARAAPLGPGFDESRPQQGPHVVQHRRRVLAERPRQLPVGQAAVVQQADDPKPERVRERPGLRGGGLSTRRLRIGGCSPCSGGHFAAILVTS